MPDNFKRQIQRLTDIGISLSAELNLERLLEKIVYSARELTSADAGTLYLLKDNRLHFKILQNKSLGIFKGGCSCDEIDLEPVPLDENHASAWCAIHDQTVRIDDVYESDEFDFSGPRHYDAITGYRSRSMLLVPMKNHEEEVIGVVQLMNAREEESGEFVSFSEQSVGLIEALASQAAVAITNAQLIRETKDIFESLIQVLAMAIDAKSHSTRNHIQKVALFNIALARAINEKSDGPFADVRFSEKEMEAIRIAGWLHDVGKITTPIWVIEKKLKLEKPFNLFELIRTRFEMIKNHLRYEASEKKLEILKNDKDAKNIGRIQSEVEQKIQRLDEELETVHRCNQPMEKMPEDMKQKLHEIAERTYRINGKNVRLLTEEELSHLSVQRGNLTREEINIMKNHILWTKKMLGEIPFSRHLKNVPLYAGQHHEKLNGTGYPEGAKGDEIPLHSRILAVADMYEALTASDRSYKKSMSDELMLRVMKKAAENGELDPRIVALLTEDHVHEQFEKEYRTKR